MEQKSIACVYKTEIFPDSASYTAELPSELSFPKLLGVRVPLTKTASQLQADGFKLTVIDILTCGDRGSKCAPTELPQRTVAAETLAVGNLPSSCVLCPATCRVRNISSIPASSRASSQYVRLQLAGH